jgi:hypothetical protein
MGTRAGVFGGRDTTPVPPLTFSGPVADLEHLEIGPHLPLSVDATLKSIKRQYGANDAALANVRRVVANGMPVTTNHCVRCIRTYATTGHGEGELCHFTPYTALNAQYVQDDGRIYNPCSHCAGGGQNCFVVSPYFLHWDFLALIGAKWQVPAKFRAELDELAVAVIDYLKVDPLDTTEFHVKWNEVRDCASALIAMINA